MTVHIHSLCTSSHFPLSDSVYTLYMMYTLCISLYIDICPYTDCAPTNCPSHKGKAIGFLWDLPEIQLAFKRRSEFAFVDNLDYFFNKAELLFVGDYQPLQMDALQTRFKTTGLTDRRYEIKENLFHIYDVGGQRKCVSVCGHGVSVHFHVARLCGDFRKHLCFLNMRRCLFESDCPF